ncbi:alpha/beta hydrolase [Spiroplasma tabanidicola]|uniref:Alpha/beta fold hydrolase n=1 Tax=Spiroplasma tabanidicola TaxID=324079 RepID=A0A6I6CDU6_9MOLU|nr:alpha/beta hydrolase [Spiroplasma tabanidicola]QGS52144.1 alpha/beta fold hydrolase [Spiroplasma tabanidicola]
MNNLIIDKLIKVINNTKANNKKFYEEYGWEQLLHLYQQSLVTEYELKEIDFSNFDGWEKKIINNRIHAIYHINKNNSDKWIVGCHGYSSSKESSALSTYLFDNLGYNIMVFDFINHGESIDGYVSFGVNELNALLEVLDHLINNFQVEHLGLIGFSMGAFTVNLFSVADKNYIDKYKVKFTISDSTYMFIKQVFKTILVFSNQQFQDYVESFMDKIIEKYQKDYKINVLEYDIVKLIEKNEKTVPTLFIHSKKDLVTYPKDSEALFKYRTKISKQDQILLFDTGAHVKTQLEHTSDYINAIKKFLQSIDLLK